MGYLKYVKEAWKKPRKNLDETYKQKLVEWRKGNSVERVDYPTRIDRARSLGYKSKQGFIVARVKVKRGGKRNPQIKGGRDSGNLSTKITQSKNYKWIGEERAQKRYPNLEVLNSYWIGQDAINYYFEVILVDIFHPQIAADNKINWLISNKHTRRTHRGLTSTGKKSRGLHKKGLGTEKVRPSVKANGGKLR